MNLQEPVCDESPKFHHYFLVFFVFSDESMILLCCCPNVLNAEFTLWATGVHSTWNKILPHFNEKSFIPPLLVSDTRHYVNEGFLYYILSMVWGEHLKLNKRKK